LAPRFTDDVLKTLFDTAQRAPSGGNLQPWHVHVMTGDKLAAFKEDAVARIKAGEMQTPTHPAYPSPLWEPQRSWRYKLGEDMYGLVGIEKDNKLGRLMWLARNSEVMMGMAIGYGNPDAKVNDLYADRAQTSESVTFYS